MSSLDLHPRSSSVLPHDPYAPFRLPNYRNLVLGGLLASMGGEMQGMAVGWELYQRTHSASALGLVGLVQFLPIVFLSLVAGQLADRHSRKWILISTQVLMMVSGLGLAVLSHFQGPVPLIFLCLFGTGVSRTFGNPARWALLPQVVPASILSNAVAWNSSAWQIASVSGPALGGAVIGLTGNPVGAYLCAAGGALACVALVVPIRARAEPRTPEAITFGSLLAGVRFLGHNRLLLAVITLDLFAVLLGGATALLPVYASDILDVGPVGLGWLQAAPSLGALAMALVMAHRPPLQRAGPALLAAVSGFGLATIVFGISRSVPLSLVMLAFTGAFDNISVVVRGTLVQVLTPDAMRGRVLAINNIFIGSSNHLGAFESGITAHYFGPIISVVGGGVGTLLIVATVMKTWPEVTRLRRLERPDHL
jgi:MFS family permease